MTPTAMLAVAGGVMLILVLTAGLGTCRTPVFLLWLSGAGCLGRGRTPGCGTALGMPAR